MVRIFELVHEQWARFQQVAGVGGEARMPEVRERAEVHKQESKQQCDLVAQGVGSDVRWAWV